MAKVHGELQKEPLATHEVGMIRSCELKLNDKWIVTVSLFVQAFADAGAISVVKRVRERDFRRVESREAASARCRGRRLS